MLQEMLARTVISNTKYHDLDIYVRVVGRRLSSPLARPAD